MSVKPESVYDATIYLKVAKAGDIDLEGPAIPSGKVAIIDAFYLLDLTRANMTLRLGYKRGESVFWFKREQVAATAYGLSQVTPTVLVEGEKPIGRVESAILADELYMVVRGRYI